MELWRKICRIAMGGRASKIKTSILLGTGEGELLVDEERLRELGFVLEGYEIEQLISFCKNFT